MVMFCSEFSVHQHRVTPARYCASPHFNERPEGCSPRLIVLHNISLPPGEYGGDAIIDLFLGRLNPKDHPSFEAIHAMELSAHCLIRRDGSMIQFVDFDKRAYHAGASCFQGQSNCNDFSIGLEIEGSDYEAFEESQYLTLKPLLSTLIQSYSDLSVQCIVGHEHIAPGRKTDPGPYFDWPRLSGWFDCCLPAQS